MPRDSSATKGRLLDAAFAEFAAYGIAGARVDRIAKAAGANKQLIYAYFGNKEQLFDEVLQRALTEGAESVPFDVEDLPGYAGAIFDHLVARPDLMRLRLWKLLERPSATGIEADGFRRKAAEVADAQRRGAVARELEPFDLLTMVLAAAQAWFWATEGTGGTGADGGAEGAGVGEDGRFWSPQRQALHRSAVVETARRMTEPKTAGA
ncbi:TetR family transcriptional regulator [Streptacidiphilus sp. N1-3]|uniref:TetR family transcriptional regulator n=1 Tax=Streptacidiphilus alkalitolerans TaxID=3342712 RepID=A0ABV6WVQ5_9ACTN